MFSILGFLRCSEAAMADLIGKVDLLRSSGPALRRPHVDTLKGSKHANMKELRVDHAHAAIRIAFAFDPKRRAILLCAGTKSGVSQKSIYRRLIDLADRLYDTHLAGLEPYGRREGQ
jgi:hypothetical protein